MFLSKIELHGFKSFAQKTALQFDPGVTAIVGPNGCGKSNVIDAVRWVLGEQRARLLRSEKMENVIFNGTARRRALGMAEVSLTIENTRGVLPTEYAEVTLTRRLYRSGDSEYLLNRTPCRLKDIQDLFMDTGMGAGAYSVIELKMIEEILSENAQDRRRLFEEAAGITKYKLRRAQSIKKLDTTQADLVRIRDLTAEIEKQVRSLERQAKKAAQFVRLRDRLHALELSLARVEFERLAADRRDLDRALGDLRDRLAALAVRVDVEEAGFEAERARLVGQEAVVSARQLRLNEQLDEIRRLESDRRLEQERLEGARRGLDRARQELDGTESRREELAARLTRLRVALAEAEPAVEATRAALDAAARARDEAARAVELRREAARGLRAAEQRAAEQLAGRRNELNRLANWIELNEQEEARTAGEAGSQERSAAELAARAALAAERLEAARAASAQAEETLAAARAAAEAGGREVERRAEALRAVERERDAHAAEVRLLEGLVASYEEFSEAVRFLARTPGWSPRPLRTVADLLACDEADRLALEAALGEYASCIVVRDAAEGLAAAARLREDQKGRAAFVVLDRLPAAPPDGAAVVPAGGARPALEAVRLADASLEPLARLLLARCFLVETLEEARTLAAASAGSLPPGAGPRFVARTGEWADAEGRLLGGGGAEASSVGHRLGRRERFEAARRRLEALDAALDERAAELRRARAALEAVPLAAAEEAVRLARRELLDAEQAEARLRYERELLARRDAELAARRAELRDALARNRARLDEARAGEEAAARAHAAALAARAGADEDLQEVEQESRAALGRHNERQVAALQARHRMENLEREIEGAEEALGAQHARAGSLRAEIEELTRRIEAGEAALAGLAARLDAASDVRAGLEGAVDEAAAAATAMREEINRLEATLRERRRAREQALREENAHAVRLAEVQTRQEDVLDRARAEHGVSLDQEPPAPDGLPDEAAARAEIGRLREQLRAAGAVNELALETFEQEKARLDFMLGQQQDLERAEQLLLETIEEINTTAAARFRETFEAVRGHFVRIFSHLFTENGQADLLLSGDDPLEAPVEIFARPRGKKPSTLSQLSGGEKTLTAIALLFSIYLVKPSPFCILDEVDAPLDDANVRRFMQLIREFSGSTQFILVTHNKLTMEAADRMYGITMEEEGVSKLVGVRFDEVPEPALEAGAGDPA